MLFSALVSINRQPTVVYGPNVFDTLAEIDGCRPESHVIVPSAEYFDNRMNINDKMCPSRNWVRKQKSQINPRFYFRCPHHIINLPVARNIMPPIQSLIYNFPNLSKTLRCEMCTIHLNCQTVRLLCHAMLVELMLPFHPI